MKFFPLCLLAFSLSLFAQEDADIFTDADFEYDPNFVDDFEDIEKGSAIASSPENSAVLSQPYDRFAYSIFDRSEKSIALDSGSEVIGRVFYARLYPQARVNFWRADMHFGLPIRFPVYDNVASGNPGSRSRGFVSGRTFIRPRPEDFRSYYDIQRAFRRIAIGKPEDPHALVIARDENYTLGNGDLLKEMSSLGLYDQDYAFLHGRTKIEPVGVNMLLGPLPKVALLGVNTRFAPLAQLEIPAFVQKFNFDLTYVGDYRAPHQARGENGAYRVDEDRRLLEREEGTAQAFSLGLSSEQAVGEVVTFRPYLNSSHLFLSNIPKDDQKILSYGAGFSLGHDLMFAFGDNRSSELALRTEGRIFSKTYVPNYFGQNYMLERVRFDDNSLVTKSLYVALPENNNWRYGYLFELSYSYLKHVSARLGYESAHNFGNNNQIAPLRRVHLLTTVSLLDKMKFFVSYEILALAKLTNLFDFDASRALLSLRGQFKILPFLYLESWATHAFGINDSYTERALWLSTLGETKSFNAGLSVELAMTF